MFKLKALLLFLFVLSILSQLAEAQCPQNIGFDYGDFTNWQGYTGIISKTDGSLSFPSTGIVPGRHTIIFSKDHQVDPYGKFPLVSPNGSSCLVKLGNEQTGGQAEKLTYTFTVPANNPNFSLIYYYAVVLQNPNHMAWQQPSFNAKVFNVTDNQYTTCGTFNFEASSNLPGFVSAPGGTVGVVYKPWSAVTINLLGYAGKTLRLEFTTNDCAPGGHFGYAYIDVNQNCSSPVSGNTYCTNTPTATLLAPSGFAQYFWFKAGDLSTPIGFTDSLTLTPAPPIGSRYAVRIVPYPGIGCEDTIYTTMQASEPLKLNVKSFISTCNVSGIDLTDTSVTSGSTADFSYTYYSDSTLTTSVIGPQNIRVSGTYYIKGTSPGGCYLVKPVHLAALSQSSLVVNAPAAVCKPATTDLTAAAITAGSDPGITLTYWKDAAATIAVKNPAAIDSSGTYYIKGTSTMGCAILSPVNVSILNPPKLVTNDAKGCSAVDLTAAAVTAGSDAGLSFSYWADSLATSPLNAPNAITSSGRYFIRAQNAACSTIAGVNVVIFAPPVLTISNPATVVYPTTVDLNTAFVPQTGVSYSFWLDAQCTSAVLSPAKVIAAGTYYVKALSAGGCYTIYPIRVTVTPPPAIDFSTNLFTPNGDNVNDVFKFKIFSYVQFKYFKIYNIYGQLVFETTSRDQGWNGTFDGKPVPAGTYYWVFDGFDGYYHSELKKAGSITIVR